MFRRVSILTGAFVLLNSYYLVVAFGTTRASFRQPSAVSKAVMGMSSAATATQNSESKSYLYNPSERDEYYQGNVAQYLLDLHDEGATFDFCGGMMFQLVLSDKLQTHLKSVAADSSSEGKQKQPIIHPASESLMSRTSSYKKSSFADNIISFHGRELRQIPSANGGMGFVLQLSYADPSATVEDLSSQDGAPIGANAEWKGSPVDPQGWSKEEIATYDGWRSDRYRRWRKCDTYEAEGYSTFGKDYGNDAFGLNHRFFLHFDNQNKMWLSAEDGCEGTPSDGNSFMKKLGGMFFGA